MKTIHLPQSELQTLLLSSHDFGDLPKEALSLLAQKLRPISINSGETVIKEGDKGNSLYFVIKGRLRVLRNTDQGLMLYNEILPGECIGETSMILRQPRTSDVSASRDSVLGMLTEDDYEALLRAYPVEFNRAFSFSVYRYLRHIRQSHSFRRAQNIVVIGLHPHLPLTAFCDQLDKAFAKHCRTRRLHLDAGHPLSGEQQQARLDQWESENDVLLMEYNTDTAELEPTVKQADQLILLTDSEASPELTGIENLLHQIPGIQMLRKHLAVIYPDDVSHCQRRSSWMALRDVERVYPVKLSQDSDFESLRRYLSNQTVGLVLGGGGARGFAHLGVLKAMQEKGIPVDVIGGNSMGALIGALVADGMDIDAIPGKIREFSGVGLSINLPIVSLMSNKGFEKALKSVFDERHLDEMWMPFFTAACNLTRGSTETLDKGPIWKAVLASNSPAGILPPVIHDGELLVDGAILDNVPVMAMRGKLGTKLERRRGYGTIIAVDVDAKEGLRVDTDIEKLGPLNTASSRLSKKTASLPGLTSILMHSSHIGSLAQRQRTKFMADYYLEPPVSHYPMLGYNNAEAIIDTAYHYAREQMATWELPQ